MQCRNKCIRGRRVSGNMATVWDDETIFRLIELFEANRILWDCASWTKDYRNKTRKLDAWDEIAKELKIPKHDVESKMHTLRSQFARERKKAMALKPAGVDMAEVEKCIKWKFYDALKFLPSGTSRGIGNDVMMKTTTANLNELLEVEFSDVSRASSRSSPERPAHPASAPSSSHRSKRKTDDTASETYDVVRRKRKYDGSKDEFDIYGQYVASELRETTDEMAVLQAKQRINNILIEMRMGKYKKTGHYAGVEQW